MATYASAYSSYQQPAKHQPPAAAASNRPSYPPSQQQQSQQSSSSTWMQPPYPGAPPMPAGVSVNPQQWQSGYWQFNPQYNRNRNSNQQHVPWIPSHHWMPQGSNQQSQQQQQQPQSTASQQQAAQQVSHNPYKRVPRPPSAEYLATQLVDNPLGLSGLDEPNKYYDKTQTPWVWRPRDLEDDAEEDSSPISESSPSNSRKNSDNPKDDPEHFTSRRELQTTFSINIVRTPDHYRRNSVGSLDHSSPSRTPSRGSRSSMESAISSRMAQLTTNNGSSSLGSIPKSVSPNPLSRQSSMPTTLSSTSSFSISPTKPDFSGPVLGGDQLSDEPASMLSPLMLSQTPKTGPSSLRSLRNNYTHPLIPSGLDPIPESSQRNVNGTPSKSKDRRPGPVGHSSSMPTIPNGYSPHRDSFEKDRDRERPRDSRDRDHPGLGSRHTTVIDVNIATNPYSNPLQRSSSPSTSSPHHIPSRSSSRQSSRSNSAHASPTYSSHHASPPVNYTSESRPSPPQGPPSKRSPPETYHHHSSLSTSSVKTISPGSYPSGSSSTPGPDPSNINMSRFPNPLPPPPQHPQANRYAYASVQRTPPAHVDHRIRRGFWNRRGDHLTQQGYIVYAPPDKAFPADLRNYPAQDEGYQDQDGVFTAFVNRPELPESLPRHGRPADAPYETFVVFDYR